MSAVEGSYLTAWAFVAALLVVAGGAGALLAPVAVACGVHRARLWPVLAGRRRSPQVA